MLAQGRHREIKGHNQANCQCNYNVITTMKQNLYNKAQKANSKLYQANYDRIFKHNKKQVRESLKVQRSKYSPYQSKATFRGLLDMSSP